MKKTRVVLLSAFELMLACSCSAQTAREYFNGLYNARGLDQAASQYVCFDDRQAVRSFFIFSESRVYKEYLEQEGKFTALPRKERDELNMGFLTYRAYERGVPLYDELFLAKDVDSWATKAGFYMKSPLSSRLRLTIAWGTLRYWQTIEKLRSDSTVEAESSTFGQCEKIASGVPQVMK